VIFGTRTIVTLATFVTTLLLAACGGGDAGSARLTLTDDECTYEGDESPAATQTFEAELENQSSKLGAFEIARIDAGGTFADVEAYVEAERQRLEDGLEILGPPAYLTLGARAEVPAGESGMLVSTVTSGEWVLWCAQEHPPTALFLVTPPLEVSE
jgi:hypothetical protein